MACCDCSLWVAHNYQEEHRKNTQEPLITLGLAPLDNSMFRAALFEQLGSGELEIPVTAVVRIQKDDPTQPLPPPGKKTIRWSGKVPPQKWMNFYTKVLSKLVSTPDLTLRVSFEVPAHHEQAQSKADETRSSLKELGLDDDVNVI